MGTEKPIFRDASKQEEPTPVGKGKAWVVLMGATEAHLREEKATVSTPGGQYPHLNTEIIDRLYERAQAFSAEELEKVSARWTRQYIDEQKGRLVREVLRPGKSGPIIDIYLIDSKPENSTSSKK